MKHKHHFKEEWTRSLVKTFTYRAMIVILDFTIAFLVTRSLEIALGFTAVANIIKTVSYYGHERVWDKITWGKMAHAPVAADEECN